MSIVPMGNREHSTFQNDDEWYWNAIEGASKTYKGLAMVIRIAGITLWMLAKKKGEAGTPVWIKKITGMNDSVSKAMVVNLQEHYDDYKGVDKLLLAVEKSFQSKFNGAWNYGFQRKKIKELIALTSSTPEPESLLLALISTFYKMTQTEKWWVDNIPFVPSELVKPNIFERVQSRALKEVAKYQNKSFWEEDIFE